MFLTVTIAVQCILTGMRKTLVCTIALTVGLASPPSARQAPGDWPQWGGPNRNFMSASTGLAGSWPANGPRKLWTRALGEGHSAVSVEGGRLYTMYRPLGMLAMVRRSQEEVVAALDAATGKTIWEYKFPSPTEGVNFSEGAGPHSTPLVTADRVYAVGSRKELLALNKANGQLVWSHDMIKEYNAGPPDRGYAPSPLLYGENVIVPMGGAGQAVAAFNAKTGALAWKAGDFEFSPASPTIIDVDGQKQLLYFAGNAVAGFDPANGRTLWSHPHKTDWGLNISTPVWGADNLLFVSAAYNNGARMLKLAQAGGKTTVQELWFQNRMRTHIGTVIRLGDFVVGSSGDFGPCPTVGVDVKTGQVLWQNRDFARSTFL
jgi:outer membrane protein assembly factor BamB